MSSALHDLAERCGIARRYEGLDGTFHDVPDATLRTVLEAMGVAAGHDGAPASDLAERPALPPEVLEPHPGTRCYLPDRPARCWGIAIQLYALRSGRNWGIGDFYDLAAFCVTAAAAGADFVGSNPVHAGFIADPDRRSPFFPSNRRFLNPLYIAVDRLPGFAEEMVDPEQLKAMRASPLVDHTGVTALKLAALRKLWPTWKGAEELPAAYSHAAFAEFGRRRGEALRRHALFEAISLAMVEAESGGAGWHQWPEGFASATAEGSTRFAGEHADEVEFHMWLQWLASVQLQAVHEETKRIGMRIGLYLDFAVGEAPDGSASWGEPEITMRGVHIGAPPDYFSANGQDWALAPLSPTALVGDSGRYRDLITDTLRYAGALRIDHVMGVYHLFLVPENASPAAGTYVRYPTGSILEELAAASHEHRTVVIGEDLGNVPRGFREIMTAAGILSYRILYFERSGDSFVLPEAYPREALACLSTHDLPTFEGWWRGDDVRLRHDHDLIDDEAMRTQLRQRSDERRQLLAALQACGLWEESAPGAPPEEEPAAVPEGLLVAVHRFLARTPSRLLAVRIEDLCGEREPVNLPGTVDSYPNWRRKLELPIEEIGSGPLFIAVTEAMSSERQRQE